MMKNRVTSKILSLILMVVMTVCVAVPGLAQAAVKGKPVIGITWEGNYTDADYAAHAKLIEMAGGIPVFLKQVTSQAVDYDTKGAVLTKDLDPSGQLKQAYANAIKSRKYNKTNVKEVMKGVDGVFFTGGEDISPTLFAHPEPVANKDEEINATRDISDYTLMAYCHDKNIPALAVCRGMQMMAIVNGAKFMQDIPTYYESKGKVYHYTHRMQRQVNRDYTPHDVDLTTKNSHLYEIVGAPSLKGVSSWHHQAVESIKGTKLLQTAKTVADGVEIIEGIECPDRTFYVGVQFHPENDGKKAYVQGKSTTCNPEICLNFFKTFVKYAAKAK